MSYLQQLEAPREEVEMEVAPPPPPAEPPVVMEVVESSPTPSFGTSNPVSSMSYLESLSKPNNGGGEDAAAMSYASLAQLSAPPPPQPTPQASSEDTQSEGPVHAGAWQASDPYAASAAPLTTEPDEAVLASPQYDEVEEPLPAVVAVATESTLAPPPPVAAVVASAASTTTTTTTASAAVSTPPPPPPPLADRLADSSPTLSISSPTISITLPVALMPPKLEKAKNIEYGERSRTYRRTVYNHEDWVRHRSPDRFVRNIASIGNSGIYKVRAGWRDGTGCLFVCVCDA
jgi:hypothetical protein